MGGEVGGILSNLVTKWGMVPTSPQLINCGVGAQGSPWGCLPSSHCSKTVPSFPLPRCSPAVSAEQEAGLEG